jgi:hypothetical protein
MTTRPDKLVVTQEDREAAARLIEWQQRVTAEWEQEGKPAWQFFAAAFADGIRKGIWDDHDVVQAFAAHRQRAMNQAADAERERCAKVAECHADDRPRRDSFQWNDGYMDACRGAAAALRLPPVVGEDGERGSSK